jgi:hypothetical protein
MSSFYKTAPLSRATLMRMKTLFHKPGIRLSVVAILTWLIPFAASIPFFDQNRQLAAPYWVFKLTMWIVLSICAFVPFRWYWRGVAPDQATFSAALLAALIVFAVNIALDAVTVIPLTGATFGEYFAQTGWAYVVFFVSSAVTRIAARRGVGFGAS